MKILRKTTYQIVDTFVIKNNVLSESMKQIGRKKIQVSKLELEQK